MPLAPEAEAESPSMPLPRLRSALQAFQSSGKAFELISPTTSPSPAPRRCKTLIILDSSFNPPTVAHMQMATSAVRDVTRQRDIASTLRGGAGSLGTDGVAHDAQHEGGIRLLLLLAVNNADKAPKPASFEHRLLMMRAFAADIQQAWREELRAQRQQAQDLHVDIGLTTHPYFHDKSSAIASSPEYDFSPSHPSDSSSSSAGAATATPATEQIFLAGYDTLIRIFNPKYYSPPVPEEGGVAPATEAEGETPMQSSLSPFLARARLRITMRTDGDWGGKEEQMRYVEGIVHGDELERVGGRREWARHVEIVEGMDGEGGLVLSSTEARSAVRGGEWERLRKLVPEGVAGLVEKGEVSWEESKS